MTRSLLEIFILMAYLSSIAEVHCDSLCTEKHPTKLNEENCDVYCNSRWGRAPLVNKPWATGKCLQDGDLDRAYCTCSFNDKDLQKFFPTKCFATGAYAPLSEKKALAEEEYLRQVSEMKFEEKFALYAEAYGKSYKSEDETRKRMQIFKDNLIVIDELNEKHKGRGNLVFGVGPFTDLTSEEYKSSIGLLSRQSSSLRPRGLDAWSDSATTGGSSKGYPTSPKKERVSTSPKRGRRSPSRSLSPRRDNPFERSTSRSPSPGRDNPSGRKSRSRSKDDSNASTSGRSGKKTGSGRSKSSPIKGTPRSRSRSTTPRKERLWVGEDPPSSEPLGAPVNRYAPSSSRPLATRWIGKDPEGDSLSDWRDPADTYPEVQNQVWYGRMCRSCWAFAVNSAIEILWALEQKEVTILSAQDLIDCVKECNGCKGGSLKPTLEHIRRVGVAKAKDYPYWADSGTCFGHIPRYLRINHFEQVKRQGEMEAALSHSPLPTGIHQPDELQHYASGIYNSDECLSDEESLNHAVTIVGHYKDAWIVRNTLGTAFGLAGHLLVEKGKCGIGHETFAVYGPELMPQPQPQG